MALLLVALGAGAAWSGSVVTADPVRAGVAGWWPWADDADRGEAVVVELIEDAVVQQAGPYFGPDVDLGDVVFVDPVVDPPAQVSDLGWWAVLEADQRSTGPFRAEGDLLVLMRFAPRNGLNGWTSGDVVERCRTVRVRYDGHPIEVDTVRADCPG